MRMWYKDRIVKLRECEICKNIFDPKTNNQKICLSEECLKNRKYISHRKEKLKKNGCFGYRKKVCLICESIFQPKTSRQKVCAENCKRKLDNKRRCEYQKNLYKIVKFDPDFVIKRFLLRVIDRMINHKRFRSIKYFNFTKDDFIKHIEKNFLEGMNWKNYGQWHIDHKRPLCTFKFINDDGSENWQDIKAANNLENLQPLWAIDNMRKNKKYDYQSH